MTDHAVEPHEGGPVVKTTPEEGGADHAVQATEADHAVQATEAGHSHDHPSDWEYIKVAILLAAITLAEVLVYYIESLGDWLILILIVMSVFKFAIVVLWFMHLRFDSRLFRRLFVTGLVLAFAVYGIVLTSFGVWTR